MASSDKNSPPSGKPSTLVWFLATGGGSGDLPKAPGTWGSLAALPCAAILVMLGGPWLLSLAILLAFVVGVWASGKYAEAIGLGDPGSVVIDEFAGTWQSVALAFVLFRLFDIFKPWPCRAAERFPGGVGIMLDDIVAGLYAAIFTWLIAIWLCAGKTLPTLFG